MRIENLFISGRFLLPALAAGIPIAVLVGAGLSVPSQHVAAVSAVEQVNAVTHKAVKPKPVARTMEVQKGDSLSQILLNFGVNQNEVVGIIDTVSKKFDPTELRPGQKISLTFDPEVPFYLLSMVFRIDPLHDLTVTRSENQSFMSAIRMGHVFIRDRAVTGTIDNSLYTDGISDGVPSSVLMEMIDVYGFEVDFRRDITHGDRFGVMWQQFDDTGGHELSATSRMAIRLSCSSQGGSGTSQVPNGEREDIGIPNY
jgi:LysM repeat protein